MKGFILLILAIIAVVIVAGGAAAFHFLNDVGIGIGELDSDTVSDVMDKVSNVATSGSSDSSGSDDKSIVDKVSDIVSEEVKYNYQNDDGSYYREVTYKDGGFRQYDVDSGKLIGSSYDSDQDQLPSME